MTSGDAQSDVAGRPTGTVTFLFTDIEGSTRLWQEHPQAMKTAVADHDRIIRANVAEHDGFVFATGGDGFSVAFAHPVEAALAAFDTQAALAGHDWGSVGSVRVRMALDTGLADERDGDYFGPALNRAARILEQTAGGEILTSNTTADILTHQLPIGYGLERVGRRHLRDVEGVTTLHRLRHTTEQHPGLALRRPAAVTAAAIVVVAAGWLALGGLSDSSDNSGGGLEEGGMDEPPTASQSAPSVESTVAWTVDLEPLTAPPIIVGDYVIASLDTDDHRLVAVHLETGLEVWSTMMSHLVTQVDTDGRYVYVTTQRRVDILHPETGEPMDGCGFDHPTAFSRTAIGNGSLIVAEGRSVYRIETSPDSSPCHGDIIENVDSVEVSALIGPIYADGHVLVADRRGWYLFDAEDLSLVREPPPVDIEDLDEVAAALAVWTDEYRMGEAQQIVAAVVDRNARLHVYAATGGSYAFDESTSVQLEPLADSTDSPSLPAPMIVDGVVVIRNGHASITGIDAISGVERWALNTDDDVDRVVQGDRSIWVATANEIMQLEPSTGAVIDRLPIDRATRWVSADAGIVLVAGDGGQLVAFGDAEARTAWEPPSVREAVDPEVVVRSFYEAWNNEDRGAVQSLLSPGAYIGDKALQFTWLERRQETLWEWMAHDQVMESAWAVGECTQEVLGANRVRLQCEATYSDAAFEAIGQPPASFTLISEVRNGAIARITPGRLVTSLRGAGPVADYGAYDLYRSLHQWATATFKEAHLAVCGSTVVTRSTQSCAEFIIEHLAEWAASTDT